MQYFPLVKRRAKEFEKRDMKYIGFLSRCMIMAVFFAQVNAVATHGGPITAKITFPVAESIQRGVIDIKWTYAGANDLGPWSLHLGSELLYSRRNDSSKPYRLNTTSLRDGRHKLTLHVSNQGWDDHDSQTIYFFVYNNNPPALDPQTVDANTALTYVIKGNSVTIKECARNASGALVIPPSYNGKPVTAIGVRAFYYCSRLTSLTIPDSVTSIGEEAFYNCSRLTSLTIPDSVTSIRSGTFYYCRSLTSVTIPDSVTSIGNQAFFECFRLTSVTIPDSVTSIGDLTFYNCSSLTSVTIPDSVTSIGRGAFAYCISLTSISVVDGNSEYTSQDGVLFDKNKTTLIQYPAGKKSDHYSIPASVTSIGDLAFEYCSSLTSVTIPDSVTSIGNQAFQGCSSLTSITFEGNAPFLGVYVFKYLPIGATITVRSGATGFGKRFGGLLVIIQEKLEINTFSKTDSPFTISFESKSGATYVIEVAHNLKQWGEIGEVQGTGSSVKFTDRREALFQKQYYRVKLVEQ